MIEALARHAWRFGLLLAVVLLVNYPAITYHAIHPEQGAFYLANQQISHWLDLFNIYFHPDRFYAGSIPYFRPSGHFLAYQLLTPIIGWHTPQALIVVNLFFLALAGYFVIQLYRILFPSLRMGGFIAFALYLMHPALIFAHLTALQFDFAYVCFSMISLYCFARFCQKNIGLQQNRYCGNLFVGHDLQYLHLEYLYWLIPTLLFYILATTFKETAIMLGPVLMLYFMIQFYSGGPIKQYLRNLLRNQQCWQILAILALCSLILVKYYSMQWDLSFTDSKNNYLLGFQTRFFDNTAYYFALAAGFLTNDDPFGWRFRGIIFSPFSRLALYTFFILLVLCLEKLYRDTFGLHLKKSLVFLLCAAGMFAILPVFLGGSPWHLSLTILFVCMAMGVSFDYFFQAKWTARFYFMTASLVTTCLALSTISMLQAHIHDQRNDTPFIVQLNYNAVLHAPPINQQLTKNSLLIVEDSQAVGEYSLGDSFYPIDDSQKLADVQHKFFLKPTATYNGTLFHWAYLLPKLQEEVYPFQIANMAKVPNQVLYTWLVHYKDIFCVGYDNEANWHDRTQAFKAQLLAEKIRRHMTT